MTEAAINTKTAPTAEAIQEALELLKNLTEQKSGETAENGGMPESLFNSGVFKTIEDALKMCAEAKTNAAPAEDDSEKEEEETEDSFKKTHTARCADLHEDEEDEGNDDNEDEDDDEDNEEDDKDDGWDIGDVLAIGAGVALGAAVVYGGIKLGKAIFSD